MKIDEIYQPSNFIDILLLHMEKYPIVIDYMESCIKAGHVLHHNTNATDSDFIVVTEDHKSPQDGTHNYFGNYFDQYFIDKFGENFRKDAIYATLSGASYYGAPFLLIPVSDYRLCYSEKVFDLYITWQKLITDIVIYEIDNNGHDIDMLTEIVFKVLRNNESPISNIQDQLRMAFEKSGLNDGDAKSISDEFMQSVKNHLTEILASYESTDDIAKLSSNMKKSNNEVMIVSDKFLLLNKKKILSKTGKSPIDLFVNVINRYNKGERF